MTTHFPPLAGVMLLLGLLFHWLPVWRRRQLWFAVTVGQDFCETPAARRALTHYRAIVWTLTIVALGLATAGPAMQTPWLAAAGAALQIVGAVAAFAIVRREVLPWAVTAPTQRVAALAGAREHLPGGMASLLVPLGLIALTALYLLARWPLLPDPMPVHWNLSGEPDRWAERTATHVFGPLGLLAGMVLFQLGLAELIVHATPRGRVPGTEAWTTRFRRTVLKLLVAGVWSTTAVMCVTLVAPMWTGSRRPAFLNWLMLATLAVSILPFAVQLVRLTRDTRSGSDGTPDACWKLGLIYVNPNDPAVFVEKRFGLGYTVNFGNLAIYWVLGAGVAVFLLARTIV